MRKSKRTQAVGLAAAGQCREAISNQLSIPEKKINEWFCDPEFIEEVEQAIGAIVREKRWGLMAQVPAAMSLLEKGVSGDSKHKVSIAEQKLVDKLFTSLGVFTDEPPKPPPAGDYEVVLGSGGPKK